MTHFPINCTFFFPPLRYSHMYSRHLALAASSRGFYQTVGKGRNTERSPFPQQDLNPQTREFSKAAVQKMPKERGKRPQIPPCLACSLFLLLPGAQPNSATGFCSPQSPDAHREGDPTGPWMWGQRWAVGRAVRCWQGQQRGSRARRHSDSGIRISR